MSDLLRRCRSAKGWHLDAFVNQKHARPDSRIARFFLENWEKKSIRPYNARRYNFPWAAVASRFAALQATQTGWS